MNIGNINEIRFPAGTAGEKAREVVAEVTIAADQMMAVDDKVDVDLNRKAGVVKVKDEYLDPGTNFTGKMSYDPKTGEKKSMNVDVEGCNGSESNLIYDKDHKDIPIFGSKKEFFSKETPDSILDYMTHVQEVRVDPKTGKASYKEYDVDNSFPEPDPFPDHHFPPHFPHNPHPPHHPPTPHHGGPHHGGPRHGGPRH